jgi:hypothetical protein
MPIVISSLIIMVDPPEREPSEGSSGGGGGRWRRHVLRLLRRLGARRNVGGLHVGLQDNGGWVRAWRWGPPSTSLIGDSSACPTTQDHLTAGMYDRAHGHQRSDVNDHPILASSVAVWCSGPGPKQWQLRGPLVAVMDQQFKSVPAQPVLYCEPPSGDARRHRRSVRLGHCRPELWGFPPPRKRGGLLAWTVLP